MSMYSTVMSKISVHCSNRLSKARRNGFSHSCTSTEHVSTKKEAVNVLHDAALRSRSLVASLVGALPCPQPRSKPSCPKRNIAARSTRRTTSQLYQYMYLRSRRKID